MAYDDPGVDIGTFTASADLSAKQFYIVKMSGDNTVTVCAAVTDVPIGVLQNKPASGEQAVVRVFGMSKVSADATLAAGNIIGTSADGQAQPVVQAPRRPSTTSVKPYRAVPLAPPDRTHHHR